MAKKTSKRKAANRTPRKVTARTVRSRSISFFIGAITVLVIGFLLFQYAQSNNYKQVLGGKTQIHKQAPK